MAVGADVPERVAQEHVGMSTDIQWTDETWNPTTGCDQVSPGCDNCYALTMAARLKGMGQAKYQTDGDPRTSGPGFGLAMHPDTLDQPFRWRKPRRVFVNSMSDLFHPKVTDGFIGSVWRTMALTPQHTYQVLTKRPKRARALLNAWDAEGGMWRDHRGTWQQPYTWPLPNVWLGVSVEDQQRADERIPALLDAPAAVRFLSCEPLLGPVDLVPWLPADRHGLGWVIVGGESGPGARPMHPDWARSLRDACRDYGAPFFFKQWGAWAEAGYHDGTHLVHVGGIGRLATYHVERSKATTIRRWGHQGQYERHEDLVDRGHPGWVRMKRVGKKGAGRLLGGRTWDEFPAEVTA